jgi:hypothetical protein
MSAEYGKVHSIHDKKFMGSKEVVALDIMIKNPPPLSEGRSGTVNECV